MVGRGGVSAAWSAAHMHTLVTFKDSFLLTFTIKHMSNKDVLYDSEVRKLVIHKTAGP